MLFNGQAALAPVDDKIFEDPIEEVEEVEETGQVEEQPQEDTDPETTSQKSYDEIRRKMTQVSMENGEFRRRNQELEQRMGELENALRGRSLSEEEGKEFINKFVNNPEAALEPIITEKAKRIAEEMIRPIKDQANEQRYQQGFAKALSATKEMFPGANTPEGQTAILQKAVELSVDMGDRNLWKAQPDKILKLAGMELYGLPKQADRGAVSAAAEQAKADALEELKNKGLSKNPGLSVNPQKNKPQDVPEVTADDIRDAIMSKGAGKLF